MIDLPHFLNSAQVASAIGVDSAHAFLAQRDRMERETLFPLPMPTYSRRKLRWRRDEVLAWVERNGLPRPAPGQTNLHMLRLAQTA